MSYMAVWVWECEKEETPGIACRQVRGWEHASNTRSLCLVVGSTFLKPTQSIEFMDLYGCVCFKLWNSWSDNHGQDDHRSYWICQTIPRIIQPVLTPWDKDHLYRFESRCGWHFEQKVTSADVSPAKCNLVVWFGRCCSESSTPVQIYLNVMNFFKQLSLNLAVRCAGFEHVDDDDYFFIVFCLCRLPDWDLSSQGNCYIFWQELTCNTSNLSAVPDKLSRVFFQSDTPAHLLRPDTTRSPLGSRSVQQIVYRDLAKSVSNFSTSFIT